MEDIKVIKDVNNLGEFLPFPGYADRKGWDAIDDRDKVYFVTAANELMDQEWRVLPAIRYMDFYRNGNRSLYETVRGERRRKLLTLCMAECITAKGEYLEEIINGIWLICEETTWVVPAHLNHSKKKPPIELPSIEEKIYVDLFSAETGSLLAWVYYFLGDTIGNLSPVIKRRMELEMERHLLVPYLETDDFNWMGLNHNDPVNNWNPWINSNMLVVYLIFRKSFSQAEQGVSKTIRSINRFIHFYAEDGGCDEGPSYFHAAACSLFDFIDELGQTSDVSYLYKINKIRNMASYIYKVYIDKDYFANFADAPPRVAIPLGLLERIGKKTNDNTLIDFLSWLKKNNYCTNTFFPKSRPSRLYRVLADIFVKTGLPQKEAAFNLPAVNWFEGIQVVSARDSGNDPNGFVFIAKGGHNGESHNHNDVGNFVLYCDGMPLLVDAGVETYTKFTFNDSRYTLWTMRSLYHNAPTINGVEQAPGSNFHASEVSFEGSGGTVKFSLDIAGAYPAAAKVKSYRREFIFGQKKGLTLTDTFTLSECTTPLELNFLCYEKPEISGPQAILGGKVAMHFDNQVFTVNIDEIPLRDPKIHNDWQKDTLYRMRLSMPKAELTGKLHFEFVKI